MESRWATIDEIKENLVEVNKKGENGKSGVPLYYEDDKVYVNNKTVHNFIIGDVDSNKVENVIIPQVKLAIKANESIIVTDFQNKIYDVIKDTANEEQYKLIRFNIGNNEFDYHINPLAIGYDLYKNNNLDDAFDYLDSIANYIFNVDKESDPFWFEMSINLFTSIAIYLYKTETIDNITFAKINSLAADFQNTKDIIKNELENTSLANRFEFVYYAPTETLASILAVFRLKMNTIIRRESTNDLLSITDFDINKIQEDKTIVILNCLNDNTYKKVAPMIVEALNYMVCLNNKTDRRINIILDDITSMNPILDMTTKIYKAINHNIRYTIGVSSITELKNTYGVENATTIFVNCSNVLFLGSNDIETLEYISRLCGDEKNNKPLAPITMLQILKINEAIILVNRMYPFKSYLEQL